MRPRICISDRFPDTTLKIHTLRTTALINISIVVQSVSLVQLFMTPRTVALQPPLSMGFPRQEYLSGLPFPSLGDLSDPGIEPTSPALAGGFFFFFLITEPPGKPMSIYNDPQKLF